jgi:NitT/TauT family transport system substrate-binding protein
MRPKGRMKPRSFFMIGASMIVALLVMVSPGSCDTTGPGAQGVKVSLIPLWIPQAQFAGYMMAKEKGFYRAAGMDMTILRGGPDRSALEYIASGKATFCVDWLPKAIIARAKGAGIVSIGQIIKSSSYMIVCKKSMATLTPEDLDGRKLAHWVGIIKLHPKAFFRKFNINMRLTPNYTSVNLLLSSAVDAISAMRYNEYHLILNSGYDPEDLVVYDFKDLGINIPEDGLYCSEKIYQTRPDLCKRFALASLKGWQYAFANKDETLAVVIREAAEANTGTNLAHQRWMLNSMEKLIRSPKGAINEKLDKRDYDYVAELLRDFQFIDNAPEFEDFYKGP